MNVDRRRFIQKTLTAALGGASVYSALGNIQLLQAATAQYSFTADDGIAHHIWVVNDEETVAMITVLFKKKVPASYIADGHHRAASAAKVRAALGADASPSADYFLTTLFPADELSIMDYNRVIKDLNGLSEEEFLEKISEKFSVQKMTQVYRPQQPHQFGLYIGKQWYKLTAHHQIIKEDALGVLDINILQDNILTPLLNIIDQRTDKRIDFIGGIRGLEELEKRTDSGEMKLAISLYPVSISQLFAVADSGEVMPPKSTWFEPKLRDGLLTHIIK